MHAGEATDEPEHDENDQYEAENAAEPSPAISAIAMVATEAAKQQDHQDDNQDCAHCRPPLQIPDIDSSRSALPAQIPEPLVHGQLECRRWANHRPYLPRNASFNPPTAFCTLPAALSVLPSASSFLSPRTLPAASFTAPLACCAEPLIRSLSMSYAPCLLGTEDNDFINVLFPDTTATIGGRDCLGRHHRSSAQVLPTFRVRHSAFQIKASHMRSKIGNPGCFSRAW